MPFFSFIFTLKLDRGRRIFQNYTFSLPYWIFFQHTTCAGAPTKHTLQKQVGRMRREKIVPNVNAVANRVSFRPWPNKMENVRIGQNSVLMLLQAQQNFRNMDVTDGRAKFLGRRLNGIVLWPPGYPRLICPRGAQTNSAYKLSANLSCNGLQKIAIFEIIAKWASCMMGGYNGGHRGQKLGSHLVVLEGDPSFVRLWTCNLVL